MLMLAIMKEYGWDYHTFMSQPTWVLDLANKKMSIEAKLFEREAENNKK